MTPIKRELVVDLNEKEVKTNILPKQWEDNARTVYVSFTSDTVAFPLEGYTASFVARKSDRKGADGLLMTEEDKVLLTFTEQMCASEGTLEVVITLTGNGSVINSPIIKFDIARGLNNNNVESEDEKNLVRELLEKEELFFADAEVIDNNIIFRNTFNGQIKSVSLPLNSDSGYNEYKAYINKYKRASIHKIVSSAALYFAESESGNGELVLRYSAGSYNYETFKEDGKIIVPAGEIPYNNARWITLNLNTQRFGYEDNPDYIRNTDGVYAIGHMYDRFGVETAILYDNGTVSNEPTITELRNEVALITSRVEKIEEILVQNGLANRL